jgi:hypothetical protein
MTASKCATHMSWRRLQEGRRGKRKRPHTDQYEEGIAKAPSTNHSKEKIGRLRASIPRIGAGEVHWLQGNALSDAHSNRSVNTSLFRLFVIALIPQHCCQVVHAR